MTSKQKQLPAITGEINHETPIFHLPEAFQPWKPAIMSYSASMVSTTVGFPLDSLKTRMQTHDFENSFQCIKYTIHNEGILGLFRGISAPLLSTSFAKSLGVAIYSKVKPTIGEVYFNTLDTFNKKTNITSDLTKTTTTSILEDDSTNILIHNVPISFVSGLIAGGCISLWGCPFEFTKIFSQILILVSNNSNKIDKNLIPKSMTQVIRQIIKSEGYKGLYSGYSYHIIRDSVSSGLFYAIYETVKFNSRNFSNDLREAYPNLALSKHVTDVLSIACAGALSGMLSWISVFPIDTMKSQYQRDIINNILRSISNEKKLEIVKPEWKFPTRKMYRGLGPSLFRSITTTVIFFSMFEYLMSNIV
ncbi:hypothetical protein B5S31_g4157 [[Candida] boidinii]|nr:hypothetical protein B5S31_g4157 [[Candida] boidinii]